MNYRSETSSFITAILGQLRFKCTGMEEAVTISKKSLKAMNDITFDTLLKEVDFIRNRLALKRTFFGRCTMKDVEVELERFKDLLRNETE
jgi:hypothetical protein